MEASMYSVFSPEGTSQKKGSPPDQRSSFSSLSEAVIAEVWDYRFRGDEIFAALRDSLGVAHPGVRFVSYDEFGDVHGTEADAVVAALPQRLEALDCNAVIAGVGA